MLVCFACSFVREKYASSNNKDGIGTLCSLCDTHLFLLKSNISEGNFWHIPYAMLLGVITMHIQPYANPNH